MAHHVAESGDRPADELDEIKVTPEMIEAGVEELWLHDITEPTEGGLAIAVDSVFRVMLSRRDREL